MSGKVKKALQFLEEVDTRVNFKECASCAAKSGSPILCESCLANRKIVSDLTWAIDKAKESLK
jgi:hypothetical protein